ncbi:lipoprotein UxpA [Stutzerimonas zhaodongensis]|uniref:lipoprotein UxpA n=1 Tax=Stutzerimonas TaxID=2901164 RepID=UPI00388DADFE
MTSMGRRQVLAWLMAGAAIPALGGCATGAAKPLRGSSRLDLLYYADTLDARAPSLFVAPQTRLGAAARIGQAPWLTGASARAAFAGQQSLAPMLDAALGPVETGGYAVLGALLERLRNEVGPQNCLTLENGQCWNGSGLAYLTQGASGVQGSELLGADVRVSSDERALWPQQAGGLYKQWGRPVLAAGLEAPGTQSIAFFERAGVQIAVVGITDPYAVDQTRSLSQWYESMRSQLDEARRQADLVVALADVGTGPGLWLAERLEQVDLVLCARGQDLWPRQIDVRQVSGRHVPVVLAGSRACGAFRIRCDSTPQGWRFAAEFHPAFAESLSAADRLIQARLQSTLQSQRASHAGWLDQTLAHAPEPMWRRDVRGGSWDRLIHQALAEDYGGGVLLPGLRYDAPLRRGQAITREHLLSLTGSHPAVVREAPAAQLQRVLENAAEQLFGDPVILDNSQDLPRLLGRSWQVAYSPSGQRVSGVETMERLRTFTLGAQTEGKPLWQYLEAYLREQPGSWHLPELALPRLTYVQGHPGWHPAQGAPA